MKNKKKLQSIVRRVLVEIENKDGFPETITHPTFGIMKIGNKFKIKSRTYYTYESNNHVIHCDLEIAKMYNHNQNL